MFVHIVMQGDFDSGVGMVYSVYGRAKDADEVVGILKRRYPDNEFWVCTMKVSELVGTQ